MSSEDGSRNNRDYKSHIVGIGLVILAVIVAMIMKH